MGAKKGKGNKKAPKKGGEVEARRRAEAVDDIEGEDYKVNLMQELHDLMNETDIENRFASLYHQERDKISYFWMTEQKNLEDLQADLRNKDWSVQELKEKHDIEIKACKQRVKHLLFNNLDDLIEEEDSAHVTLKNAEDDYRVQERGLKYDVRSLNVQDKEKEVCHEEYLRALKKEEDKKKMELRHEFERRAADMKNSYGAKMTRLRNRMEGQKNQIIAQIEAKMGEAIKELIRKHDQARADIKQYYKNITDTSLSQLKSLQDEVFKLRARETTDLKTLYKLETEEKNFEIPTKQAYAKQAVLEEELKQYREDKEELHSVFNNIKDTEENIRKWTWQTEVLTQQMDYVTKERDDVYNRFTDSVVDVQQKVGLKNLILEKKLETIRETLEAKEVQLYEVMSAANLTPDARAMLISSLEDIENNKNEEIAGVQADLKKIREAHSNMVKTYEGKLFEFGIPVEELGFDPLVPANSS